MNVRSVKYAFVSAAFFAAIAMTCGTSNAESPSASAQLARQAYSTLQAGDAEAAIAQFTQAIESRELESEVLANALLNRALAYQQLGEHSHAIDDYTAALSLDAMSPSLRSTALYNRGLSNQKSGKVSLAVEDFTGSLLLNPQFPQAYFSRANALRDSGQLLFALSDYERALRYKHPDPASVYYGSAVTYLALKRPQDAKRAFNAALTLNPAFGQARAQLVLLGDETAKAETDAGSDPVLTGSVASLSGGTVVTKPGLPKAVEPPAQLMQVVADADAAQTRKIADRLPAQVATEDIAAADATAQEEIVAVEQVPAIPEPVTATVQAPIKAKPAAAKVVASAEPAQAAADASDTIETSSIDPVIASSAWTVQVASAVSEDAAWSTWKKMQARFKVLKSSKPNVVKADLGAKGTFFRVRLGGFDDQASAKAACAKLKAGGVSCYISKSGS